MYKYVCPECLYETMIFANDDKELGIDCEICGTPMTKQLIPDAVEESDNRKESKEALDNILVENMIAYIKEQGEPLVWQVLNQTKLEYRLDDLACFFEAKARMK